MKSKRLVFAALRRLVLERSRLADDERELLGQTVVQVAGDPPPLAERRRLRELLLPRCNLSPTSSTP